MNFTIIGSIYIMETVKYHMAFEMVYREKLQKKWNYCVGGLVVLVYMLYAGGDDLRDYILTYASVVLATAFAITGKCKDKILKSFLICILITSIDEVPSSFLSQIELLLQHIQDIHYWINFFTSLWGLVVLKTAFYFYKKGKEHFFLSRNKIIFIVIISGLSLALTIASLNVAKESVDKGFKYFTDFVVSIAYISLCMLCWLLVYFRNQHEQKTREIELKRMLMEEQKSYYQTLLKKEDDTRRFRHDIENHLLCLDELAGQGDIARLKQYLHNMSGQIKKIRNMLYTTGNTFVDVILNDKIEQLEKEATITVRGIFPPKLNLLEMDICTIFSNLFQNAVEEINQQEEGWLKVVVQSGKQYTEIVIQNSARGEITLDKNGLPYTVKDNKKNHGLGLQNVKAAVEKNNGRLIIYSKRDSFEVKIQFHN